MANTDYRKLDDDEIVKLVDDNVRLSTGYSSSDLAKEREKVLNYYNGTMPKPHEGTQVYQDVYNAVQSCKLRCLNICRRQRIVRFAPQGQDDRIGCDSHCYCDFKYSEPMMATLYSHRSSQMPARTGGVAKSSGRCQKKSMSKSSRT